MALDDIADELYGLDPRHFTIARNDRAKASAAKGDRPLAAAVRKLGKPTVPAWLANVLARTRRSSIDELLQLGSDLRQAQSSGRRDDVKRFMNRRRELIQDLLSAAAQYAEGTGHPLASPMQRQLEETLEAAVADPALGAALREGRLTEALRFVGFGDTPPAGGPRRERTKTSAAPTARQEKARAQVHMLESAVEHARQRHQSALDRHLEAAKALRAAERSRDQTARDLDKQEQLLAKAKAALGSTVE